MFFTVLRTIAAGCVVLLFTAPLISEQHPPRTPMVLETMDPEHLPAPFRVVRDFLELTQEQMDQFLTHRQDVEESTHGVRHELAVVERTLYEALEMAEPSRAEVGELFIRLHQLRKTIREAQASLAEGFVGRLDEGQRQKLQLLRTMAAASRVMPAFRELGLVPRDGAH